MANLKINKEPTSITQLREYNPFLSIQRALDRAIGKFEGMETFEPFHFPLFSKEHFENVILTPRVDIIDDENHFKVEIEMPGVDEKDVNVSLSDNLLTIKAEKTVSKKDEGKMYQMREIGYGRYERSLTLPDTVDINNAKASFKKGMLWVDIPKKAESIKKPRTLTIEKAE